MSWTIPTDGDEFAPDGNTNSQYVDKAGKYFVEIQTVIEDANGNLDVTFKVLSGDHDNQAGRTCRCKFWKPKDANDNAAITRIQKLTIAAGIVTEQQYATAKATGAPVNFDLPDLEGKRIVVELKANDKGYFDCGWKIYPADSEDAKHVPVSGDGGTPFDDDDDNLI